MHLTAHKQSQQIGHHGNRDLDRTELKMRPARSQIRKPSDNFPAPRNPRSPQLLNNYTTPAGTCAEAAPATRKDVRIASTFCFASPKSMRVFSR